MIYWLQGNQRRSWANDCEGEGEGQAEERPRHRQDVRVHHGRRRHGGEVGKGGQENVLFSYVFISGRLNRERNSDESERQWKLARRKRRCSTNLSRKHTFVVLRWALFWYVFHATKDELRIATIQLELDPEEDYEARKRELKERELSVSSGDEATVTFIKNLWGHWT